MFVAHVRLIIWLNCYNIYKFVELYDLLLSSKCAKYNVNKGILSYGLDTLCEMNNRDKGILSYGLDTIGTRVS